MNEKVPNSWSKFWRQKMVRTLLFFNRRCQNMASNLKPFLASKTLPVCVIFAWNGQAFCVVRAIEGSEPAWCPSLAVSCFFFWPRAGPAQPQPQNCKASLLYLTSGGVGFTGMEVRTDSRWNRRGPWIGLRNLVVFMNSNSASINGAMTWGSFHVRRAKKSKG